MNKYIGTLIALLLLAPCLAEEQEFITKFSWSEVNNMPRDISFEGEVAGYLSIFKSNESWHIYLYRDRESLIEHNELNFMKVDKTSFANTLNIKEFQESINLLKSLDQRFVRISGKLKKSESSVADVPFYIDSINSLKWRGIDGKWNSDVKNGLSVSQFKAGRLLKFPDAIFFEHPH